MGLSHTILFEKMVFPNFPIAVIHINMNIKNLTIGVIMACAVILIAYDFWVGFTYGGDYTESWIILQYSHSYPVIPFAFGFLMGHLFANMHGDSGNNTPSS
jgi:hypothetical protein